MFSTAYRCNISSSCRDVSTRKDSFGWITKGIDRILRKGFSSSNLTKPLKPSNDAPLSSKHNVNNSEDSYNIEKANEITEENNNPMRGSITECVSITNNRDTARAQRDMFRPFSLPNGDSEDIELFNLRKEVKHLNCELVKCRTSITCLKEREACLQDRLEEQAQKQFHKGPTNFEDISTGALRPSELIRSFGDIYTESRLDAFDALDDIPQMQGFDDLKGKLLFSIVVLSFRSVEREIATTKQQIRDLLNQSITPLLTSSGGDVSEPSGRDGDDDRSDPSESGADTPSDRETYDTSQQQQQGEETTVLDNMIGEFEVLVNDYLCQSVREQRHDITKNIEEVSNQMCLTLYDYPALQNNDGLAMYIEEIVRLAWALSVQKPPLTIAYDFTVYDSDRHQRFHASDPDRNAITAVLWPALKELHSDTVVHKAVVIT